MEPPMSNLPTDWLTGWRPPRWLGKVLGVAGAAAFALWLLGRSSQARERSERDELAASQPVRAEGQRFIVLAGRQRSGKSAVANQLAGSELFGPEGPVDLVVTYREPWLLRELPAAAVTAGAAEVVAAQLGAEDVLVLVVDEQLYHQEKRFVAGLRAARPGLPVLVLVNKQDLLLGQYTAEEAETIRASVRDTMAPYVERPEDVVWGAAGASQPDLSEFRARLDEMLGELE